MPNSALRENVRQQDGTQQRLLQLTGLCLMLLAFTSACSIGPNRTHAPGADHLVQVHPAITFEDLSVCRIHPRAVPRLLRQPLRQDDSSSGGGLVLINERNNRLIRVRTCDEYLRAKRGGAYPPDAASLIAESWFMHAASVLQFVQQSTPPTRGNLPENLLSRLPVDLLVWNDSDEKTQLMADGASGRTIQDYAESGRVSNLVCQPHEIQFESQYQKYTLLELARSDVDGDGFEDALIMIAYHMREGSGRGYEIYRITQTTPQGRLSAQPWP